MIRAFLVAALKSVLGGGTLPLIIGAAALAVVTTAYFKGASHQKAKCETAGLKDTIAEQQAALARLKHQLTVAEYARRAATERSNKDAEETAKSRVQADVLKQENSKRIDRGKLSPVDAKRLRGIGR